MTEEKADTQAHLALAQDVEPPDKASIIEHVFNAMEAGATLNMVALSYGYSPASIWRWLNADSELLVRYEEAKIQRSRALMEHALYEMQAVTTLDQAKIAEKRAKHYLMQAARLNPKEFSDKVHAIQLKQGTGRGQISFVLNFGADANTSVPRSVELKAIPQPEDGEIT